MFPIMTNILQSSESPRVNLRALPASNSVLTWLVLAPRDTPNAERRPGARDSHMTHRWREMDSNFRYRGRRPASGRSLHAQRVETDAAKREFGSGSCLFAVKAAKPPGVRETVV